MDALTYLRSAIRQLSHMPSDELIARGLCQTKGVRLQTDKFKVFQIQLTAPAGKTFVYSDGRRQVTRWPLRWSEVPSVLETMTGATLAESEGKHYG